MLIQKRKQKRFNIIRGKEEIRGKIDRLPYDDECLKFISSGGFSSICFTVFISEHAKIKNMHVSSFRVGKKEIQMLHALKKRGRLEYASFILCSFAKDESGGAFQILDKVCREHNWNVMPANNHSKVHLYDTSKGKFVLETSSNLNENPKMEQFSFERDADLYDFYKRNMFDFYELKTS